MGVVFFYHLTRTPLEATLPMLLSKARQADWRVVVRGTNRDRMVWLDEKLWLGADDGFLAHGLAGGAFDADQPVLLTTELAHPNKAECLMTLDGAQVTVEEVAALKRVCVLFDGHDASAVQTARTQWRDVTDGGCRAQYWSQESGRWEMKAQSR